MLQRAPTWAPTLRTVVLVGGLMVATAILVTPNLRGRVGAAIGAAALVVALAGPAAYSLQTASVAHGGSIPSAGPSTGGRSGGPGGAGGPGGVGGPLGAQGGTATQARTGGFAPPAGQLPGATTGSAGATGTGARAGGTGGASTGGAGGLLEGSTSTPAITKLLQADASAYRWAAAAVGSNSASGYQLASGEPVMAIGGFNGSDPSPTLAQFQAWVTSGDVHYFIAAGGGGGGQGGPGASSTTSTSSAISTWVTSNYTAKTVDGVTLCDLTAPTAS